MKYAKIPFVAQPVSKIILGTSGGRFASGGEVDDLMSAALECGINAVDTARVYGQSEEAIGRWLKKGQRREKIIIISKGCHPSMAFHRRVNAAAGAVIKARGLHLTAYNGSDKVTDRSSRVKYLVATLSLVENEIAERGPVRVYVRVKNPDGILLLNSASTDFTVNGETLSASASREVDYEGQEVEMSIYVKDIGELTKGIYTVESYTDKALLGRSELMLR